MAASPFPGLAMNHAIAVIVSTPFVRARQVDAA